MNTQGLPTLDESQISELIRLSEGRAVSYCDSPKWCCGVRKTTHIARDGQTDVEPFGNGTCHSLAYSLGSHCNEYQRCASYMRESVGKIEQIRMELQVEQSRKRPSKRRIEALYTELRWAQQDVRTNRERMEAIRAKYFHGYEARLLVGE